MTALLFSPFQGIALAVVLIWVVIFLLEVAPFGSYLFYMRRVALYRDWNVKVEENYEPNLSILLPIYNEESVIEKKLNNIVETCNYPPEKLEIVIVDSASTDHTVERIKMWQERNHNFKINLFVEPSRQGMVHAENIGLDIAKYDIVVKTDADCFWEADSLRNALKYLADPSVGAAAGLHNINSSKEGLALSVEKQYRDFYAWLRVGESKIFGTVLYEGELMAFKKDILKRLGGFDEEIGGDDVPLALKLAQNHLRAISISEARFIEFVPYTWKTRFSQKIRRGKHVVQALWKYRKTKMNGGASRLFIPMEMYIYMLNPVLFFALCAASLPLFFYYPILLIGLVPLFLIGSARGIFTTHATNSMIMVEAMLSLAFDSLRGKNRKRDLTWAKVDEIRTHHREVEGEKNQKEQTVTMSTTTTSPRDLS